MMNAKAQNCADAMDSMDAKLDFATAILTLIIAGSGAKPPTFERLNCDIQVQILDGLRTLIEGAKVDADAAYNARQSS